MRLGSVNVLRVFGDERDELDRAASFLAAGLGPLVDQEMIESGQQKRAAPSSFGVSQRASAVPDQACKELLCQGSLASSSE